MSCDATVTVTGGRDVGELAEWAALRLHELERRWSRFETGSEISRLNAAGGRPCRVSADTVRLVVAMVQAWHVTGGAFDPTLLGTLVELGYATSRDDARRRTSLAPEWAPRGSPDRVLVDTADRIVQLPAGTTLDPGGLGKGFAADLVAAELIGHGAHGALVEIGGDLCVRGVPPVGDAWAVAVRPAVGSSERRIVDLAAGGIATSSSRLRTWTDRGRHHHHLIDPRTRRSADGDVVACTVVAGSAAWAESFTKLAFVRDLEDAVALLEHRALAALVTTADGAEVTTAAWEEFVR